jgi:hypothetical protein
MPELPKKKSENFQITDTTLHNLATNCSRLKHLTLSRCERITDEGIRHLSSVSNVSETLQVLELDNCPLITDSSLEQLCLCQNLVQLELYDCQHISRAGIKKLQVRKKRLFHFSSIINFIDFVSFQGEHATSKSSHVLCASGAQREQWSSPGSIVLLV